jgi:hypothetical protein
MRRKNEMFHIAHKLTITLLHRQNSSNIGVKNLALVIAAAAVFVTTVVI